MATLVIKNLPEELHVRLKEQARRHHRSVTKEVVNLIEAGLRGEEAKPSLPAPIRLKSGYRPTLKDIENAIAEGQD